MSKHDVLLVLFTLVAIFEALLFGVVHAGWSSYIYVLIDRGFYAHLCQADNHATSRHSITNGDRNFTSSHNSSGISRETSCVEQQEQLNLLYTIAIAVLQLLVVTWGYLTYKYGIIKPKVMTMLLFIGGILMLGFASPANEIIIVPGLICIGVGGVGILILNMKVTMYLKWGTGIYVAVLNGAADSSVIIFRFVKMMHEHGVEDLYPFLGIAILNLLVGSISTMFHKIFLSSYRHKEVDIKIQSTDKVIQGKNDSATEEDKTSLKDSICSVITLCHLIWFSILVTTLFMYIGTINKRLQDDFQGEVSYFTNMMSYIMLGGLVSSFLSGGLLEWQNTFFKQNRSSRETKMMQQILPLSVTSLSAILLNLLTFVTSEVTLYIEFALLTLFRSLYLTSNMNFIISMYPPQHTNVIYPIIVSTGGVVSSVQYGLFRWYNAYESAHIHVKVTLAILAVLSLVNPFIIFMTARSISRTKDCSKSCSKPKSCNMTTGLSET